MRRKKSLLNPVAQRGDISRRRFIGLIGASTAALSTGQASGAEFVTDAKEKLNSNIFAFAQQKAWKPGPVHAVRGFAGINSTAYEIGDLAVLSVSPNFAPDEPLQNEEPDAVQKIKPKRSSEISSNYIGTTPPRLPRSIESDLEPFVPFHLQDGDPETAWMSRGQARDSVQPEWIRIDLPFECPIQSVKLHPLRSKDGGFPKSLMIEISRDGWHWEKVYENSNAKPSLDSEPFICPLESPKIAKQVRVTGQKLRLVHMGSAAGSVGLGYAFALRAVSVVSPDGRDLANITNGAGIVTSSVNYGYPDKRSIQDKLFQIHYDLGVKQIKIAYWDSTLNWHWVEREKGKYVIDPRTDDVITECVNNGIEVYMTLAYGNWLYTEQGHPPGKGHVWGQLWQFPFIKPPVPLNPTYRKAYCNFVAAMVTYFKGRIRWFEIWNEENEPYSWPPDKIREYAVLVKETAATIRKSNPDAKIILGGVCFLDLKYFKQLLEQGVGPVVDAIAWHPYQWEVPPEVSYPPPDQRNEPDPYPNYRARVKALMELARRYGYKGNLWLANETTWVAPYPAPDFPVPGGSVTEMVKAKYVARTICLHADMGIPVYYNETWNTGITYWDCSLLRNTASAWPESPVTPQPAYYVLRSLATITDGAHPSGWPVEIRFETGNASQPSYETCRLRYSNGDRLLGIWLATPATDTCAGRRTTVTLKKWRGRRAEGIHVLNGTKQVLKAMHTGEDLIIPDLMVRDYPLLILLPNQ